MTSSRLVCVIVLTCSVSAPSTSLGFTLVRFDNISREYVGTPFWSFTANTPPLMSSLAKSTFLVSFPFSFPIILSFEKMAQPTTRSFFCPFCSWTWISGANACLPEVSSLSMKSHISTVGALLVNFSSRIICASSNDMMGSVVLFRFRTSRAVGSLDTKMNTSDLVSVSLLYQSIVLINPPRATSSLKMIDLAWLQNSFFPVMEIMLRTMSNIVFPVRLSVLEPAWF
ncbi:hypothetical protein D3C75_857660 [compost metagenome]